MKNHVFYAIKLGNIVNVYEPNEEGDRKYAKTIQEFNDLSFTKEMKSIDKDLMPERLEYHLAYFLDKGGVLEEWLSHTKKLIYYIIDFDKKIILDRWIKVKQNKIEKQKIDNRFPFSPKPFSEIMKQPNKLDACLELLKELDSPCIDDTNKYLREKGIIATWFKQMEDRSMFKPNSFKSDKERAETLNLNFPGIDTDSAIFGKKNQKGLSLKEIFEKEINVIKTG